MSLQRFISAQDEGIYEEALGELRAGRKRGHWMWFIFPQMRGLGASPMAHHYGIVDRVEAQAYLAHPVLGARLEEVTRAVLQHGSTPLRTIFGHPDDLKFHSSITLFAAAASRGSSVFGDALQVFFAGAQDEATLRLLASARSARR